METVFVTGHRGLLGSACVRRLKDQYKVLTMEHNLMDETWVRYWFAENKPNYVINCAAKVGGVKANRDHPVSFLVDNLTMQNIVISAAADFGVQRLINIGTSCLYPKDCRVPVREVDLLSGPFEKSVEAYAIAKLAGLALCRAYNAELGKSFITVCPANLYGPGDKYGPSAHVIPALIKRFSDAKSDKAQGVEVWGDGTATREFLYSDDCAYAIIAVMESTSSPDLINIGTGESTSIHALVRLIQQSLGTDMEVVWQPGEPTGIKHKTFDTTIIQSIGWQPDTDLATGLDITIKDFLLKPNTRY